VSSERETTGAVRNVSAAGDTWAEAESPPLAGPSDDAMEAFFAADPAVTARSMLAAGAVATETRKAGRYEARKVRRLVRHIEPWSVLKISLIFYFCIWIILLVAGTILWRVADSSGMIDNIEKFIKEIFALKSFTFEARRIFRIYAVGGLVTVVAATGFTVLLSVLFNLISDLTGGVRITVIEEESARPVRRR
jgi:Transmembrane domain of unknown function (DUF3566)